jgi:hypothetical protein
MRPSRVPTPVSLADGVRALAGTHLHLVLELLHNAVTVLSEN